MPTANDALFAFNVMWFLPGVIFGGFIGVPIGVGVANAINYAKHPEDRAKP